MLSAEIITMEDYAEADKNLFEFALVTLLIVFSILSIITHLFKTYTSKVNFFWSCTDTSWF